MIISIDGLGVNGKSTLAKMISKEIGFKNFNTGAIYRCIALEIMNQNLDINNIEYTIKQIEEIKIDFIADKTFLNDKDVSKEIRTDKVSFYSTKWATIEEIKEVVRKIQRNFIKENNTVMEGRDIGTRIVPEADMKFYLYSDFETRVERLWKTNQTIDIDEVRKNLKIRDDLDIKGGNFIKPIDAIEIDTANKTIDEIFEYMIIKIRERN